MFSLDNFLGLHGIAETAGVDVSIIRLPISLLFNYIFAIAERWAIGGTKISSSYRPSNRHRFLQHVWHIFCGFMIMYWNFGNTSCHLYGTVFGQWILLQIGAKIGLRKQVLGITWIFQVAYLLSGYYEVYYSTTYTMIWTMPQCVVCLRMIMLATDVFDGGKPQDQLKPDQKITAVRNVPRLFEMFAYSTHYGACLIGPQFTLAHYRNFVDGISMRKCGADKWFSETKWAAVQKLLFGLALTAFFAVLGPMVSADYMQPGGDFFNWSLFQRVKFIYLFGYLQMFKYLSVWVLGEGALILSGMSTAISVDRKTKEETLHHENGTNVKVWTIVKCNVMSDFVDGFNINTNKWVANYCYKRLAFLGNRMYSQIASLLFLALWHGFHSGYWTCFFYEFMTITVEKEALARGFLVHGYGGNKIRAILQKFLHMWTICGYCLIDFVLLKNHKYIPVWQSVYFYGHIFVICEFILLKCIPKAKKKTA